MESRLQNYLELWDLSCPEQLVTTPTASLYKVLYRSVLAVLKLFTGVGALEEVPGSHALKFFAGQGAVQLLKSDVGAQLVEHCEGGKKNLPASGRDSEATQILIELTQLLQRRQVQSQNSPKGLVPLAMRYQALFERPFRADASR